MISSTVLPILALPRLAKRLIVLAVDISICTFSVWLAFYLRVGEFIALSNSQVGIAAVTSIVIAIPIFIVFGFYRALFRYSGWLALMTLTRATALYGLIYAAIFTAVGINGIPRAIGVAQPIMLLLLVGFSRAVARYWLGDTYRGQIKYSALPKVLIYGAGTAGRQLAAALENSHEMRVVGFLDDDDRLHNHILNGLPIYNPFDLQHLAETDHISDVLLALPSTTQKRRNEILEEIRRSKVSVRTLPSLTELAQGKVSVTDLQELDIDDLLGREPVTPNPVLLAKNIQDKVVLVTGAGGSIGSELCRQIISTKPSTLVLVEQSEFALYQIHQELSAKIDSEVITLIPFLASVRNEDRMRKIITACKPFTIFHAAAYKHVPLVEHNPVEGITNNVMGTLTTAKVAADEGVTNFVLISTDKAVRPTNIMGASKRLAEMVLQALALESLKIKFTMVRFGNVLGSSGSVVPKFRQQIREGGPITLTHPEMTRYFMTIPEAAQLVIQASSMANGGDVFVLDMGQPVKIMDLAIRMIELSGLTIRNDACPDGDIEIAVSGLRPGEKLYEELLIGENPRPTSHPRIMKAHEEFLHWSDLQPKLQSLQNALDDDDIAAVRDMLKDLVSGYVANPDIVDWIHMKHEEGQKNIGTEATNSTVTSISR